MNYVIEKHITKKYEVTDIARFLKFETFLNGRKGMAHTPNSCLRCGYKFVKDDYTYLGIVKGDKNRIFCASCGEHIVSILGKKEISKLT